MVSICDRPTSMRLNSQIFRDISPVAPGTTDGKEDDFFPASTLITPAHSNTLHNRGDNHELINKRYKKFGLTPSGQNPSGTDHYLSDFP